MRRVAGKLLGLAVFVSPSLASAQNATVAGDVTSPHPTFTNLSIRWSISGDVNTNAIATVRYGKTGESNQRSGLPLFRVPEGTLAGHSIANQLSGSLFGLEPNTEYDIELTLVDPDGGNATRQFRAATRALPVEPAIPHRVKVTPDTLESVLAAASPGDIFELADGTYPSIVVTTDGTAAQPVVLRAAKGASVLISGDVRLDGRSHVWIEGFTIQGKVKCNDSKSVVIRRCNIDTPDFGIVAYGNGTTDSYIVDNVITGVTAWTEAALGVDGNNIGEGVQLTGPGNVIAFNRVRGFRDCVSLLEEGEAIDQTSIDIYGNDLSSCADDAIEADYSMGNVRVYQNRIENSFMGISSQPSLGGPTYFLRNAMYNVLYEPFKLHNGSRGNVILQNTVVKSGDALIVATTDPITRATFRNNLFIGGPGGNYNGYDTGSGSVMTLASADSTCSLDYDGFGTTNLDTFAGRLGAVRFSSVTEMQSNTTEIHGVDVGPNPFAIPITYPTDPFNAPTMPSLQLATDSPAIDHGIPLDNVNDDFAGNAPDLGAYELGQREPTYGPGGDLGNSGSSGSGGTGGSTSEVPSAGSSLNSAGSSGKNSGVGTNGGAMSDDATNDTSGCGCRLVWLKGGLNHGLALYGLAAAGLMIGRRLRNRNRRH